VLQQQPHQRAKQLRQRQADRGRQGGVLEHLGNLSQTVERAIP
jgi:hypothetical protein